MTRTVPLSQFMPYGAPELLAAESRHLSRATITSSALATAVFLVALLFSPPRWAPEPIRVVDVAPRPYVPLLDLQESIPPAPPATPMRSRTFPDECVIRPTADPEAPPVEVTGAQSGPIEGDVKRPLEGVVGVAGDREEPPPDFNDPRFPDELPVLVTKVEPEYPSLARQAGVEGRVVVHILVGKDGRVLKTQVAERFSNLLLNEAALEAAQRCVFKPALTNNRPVAVWVAMPFDFRLY